MRNADFEPTLAAAERLARRWIDGIDSRPTSISSSAADVVAAADRPFPEMGLGGAEVLEELAAIAEPGLASTGSGRYLALVTGGVTPAALGADWMVSAWDQNAVFADLYPGVVGVELAAARWILEALDLPGDAAVGFTTGGQGANTAGLLAGRHAVLAAHGHDVETAGLIGAPRVNVLLSDEQHSTIPRALRLLGLGTDCATEIPTDSEGRILLADLSVALDDSEGPTIVCVQAGNVNGGAFDPIAEISAEIQRRKSHRDDIWLHVDERSVCGSGPAIDSVIWPRGSRRPTLGPSMRTSGSTPRTTAGSSSCAIAGTWRGQSAIGRPTSPNRGPSPTRLIRWSSRREGREAFRSGRRCGHSAGPGSATWSIAVATVPRIWPQRSRRSKVLRSCTRRSTRLW